MWVNMVIYPYDKSQKENFEEWVASSDDTNEGQSYCDGIGTRRSGLKI